MARNEGYVVEAQDPKEVGCDWCGEPSYKAIRKRKSATFMYACSRHVKTAEATNEPPPRKERKIP